MQAGSKYFCTVPSLSPASLLFSLASEEKVTPPCPAQPSGCICFRSGGSLLCSKAYLFFFPPNYIICSNKMCSVSQLVLSAVLLTKRKRKFQKCSTATFFRIDVPTRHSLAALCSQSPFVSLFYQNGPKTDPKLKPNLPSTRLLLRTKRAACFWGRKHIHGGDQLKAVRAKIINALKSLYRSDRLALFVMVIY